MPAGRRSITQAEAEALLRQADYCDDAELRELLAAAMQDRAGPFRAWLERAGQGAAPSAAEQVEKQDLALALLRERCEHYDIAPGIGIGRPAPLELRVGRNAVFHLGRTLRTVTIDGLALFFAYAAPVSFPALYVLWAGASLADLARTFVQCYVKIEEPKEQLVFETVYRLQNQLAVTDFQALAGQDYERAYGQVCPTRDEVGRELAGQVEEAQLDTVLYALKGRGILGERNGRWFVPFW